MRITSKIFEASDLATKKELLHTTQVYQQVATLYEKFVLEFSRQRAWFLTRKMKDDTLRKRYKQCERFVDITLELNVPFDVYMKVQFEILTPFLKKTAMHSPRLKFGHLISPKAVARFKENTPRLKERFTGTEWMDEYIRSSFVDVGKSIINSAKKFYDRLRNVYGDTLELSQVIEEFEMLARAGELSNIYVWSSPLECAAEFIVNLRQETEKKLTENQKRLAEKARAVLSSAFEDKEIAKYV